jgi:porphobilinogen synthase
MEIINYPMNNRRQRLNNHIRELSSTVHLNYRNFIQPIFIDESLTDTKSVQGLSNVFVETDNSILQSIKNDIAKGITKFLLFPIPANKKSEGFSFSFAANCIKKIKEEFGTNVWVAADICLCSYTTHGHCGILNKQNTLLLNNETVQVLGNYALQLAQAGADCIAPSDMMDGRIQHIRNVLDSNKLDNVSIMSYATKFSSQFYGPFRDACNSAPDINTLKNRKSYQISSNNYNDAINSALRDAEEGADVIMIKPAALYTDVIAAIKQKITKPIAAYHVSGEYAAIESLASQNLVDREKAHLEVWTALVRSGANIIISYAARNAKQWIENMEY